MTRSQPVRERHPRLLVATSNVGKFRELCDLLCDLPIALRSLEDFPGAPTVPEDAAAFEDNALAKATTIARWSRCTTLADDSGLEVDALHGAPGVLSARFAGANQDSAANIEKLLRLLRDVPPAQRTARFRCVIAIAAPGGATLVADGTCEGRIADVPRGDHGFGYDPVFLDPESGQTFAELPAALKNRLSHRARACARLRPQLLEFLSVHPWKGAS